MQTHWCGGPLVSGGSGLRIEEHVIAGKYKVDLVYDGDELIGAYVEVPTIGRIYIPRRETVLVPRLSKKVKRFLEKYGFKLL
jgi:hypothetical protein